MNNGGGGGGQNLGAIGTEREVSKGDSGVNNAGGGGGGGEGGQTMAANIVTLW